MIRLIILKVLMRKSARFMFTKFSKCSFFASVFLEREIR